MDILIPKYIGTAKLYKRRKIILQLQFQPMAYAEFISTLEKTRSKRVARRKNQSLLCLDIGELKDYYSCNWRTPQTFCPALQNGALSMQHYFCEKKSTLAIPYWSKFWRKVTFILKLQSLTNFTVSPCISIHYLYMFQQMHLLYYNTNFSVNY
jgi:hypothetical protein